MFLNFRKSYQIDMEKRLCVLLDKAELNVSQLAKVYSLRMKPLPVSPNSSSDILSV